LAKPDASDYKKLAIASCTIITVFGICCQVWYLVWGARAFALQ